MSKAKERLAKVVPSKVNFNLIKMKIVHSFTISASQVFMSCKSVIITQRYLSTRAINKNTTGGECFEGDLQRLHLCFAGFYSSVTVTKETNAFLHLKKRRKIRLDYA